MSGLVGQVGAKSGIAGFATSGTWTPTWKKAHTDSDLFTGHLDSSQGAKVEGFYEKVGKIVYLTGLLRIDSSFAYASGMSGSDHLAVGGLPFNASKQSSYSDLHRQGIFPMWFGNLTSYDAGYSMLGLLRSEEDGNPRNQIVVYYMHSNTVEEQNASVVFNSNSQVGLNGFYFTDE